MALSVGVHQVGPDQGALEVRTYREGVAAKVGHDLIIDVTRWEARLDVAQDVSGSSVELDVDPRSLEVREGRRGVKPLTDRDRKEIRGNIDEKILRGQPISFRSSAVSLGEGGDRLAIEGELTMAGVTKPLSLELDVHGDGRVTGEVTLTQTEWGIKPYRGLMGALRVRDDVEVVIAARLPSR